MGGLVPQGLSGPPGTLMGPEVSQRFTTRADVIAPAQALLGYLKAGGPKEILGFGAERGPIIQRHRLVRRACAALLIMLATRAPLLPCIRHQQEQTANG